MLTSPALTDQEIIACLRDAYGLDIATISVTILEEFKSREPIFHHPELNEMINKTQRNSAF